MANEDTLNLLKECNSGIKMAVSSIDEVLPKVQDSGLKDLLIQSKQEHSNLGDETHKLILSLNDTDKEPNPIAKAMSWVKINVKMLMDNSDHEIADIMSQGCEMGINSLNKYLEKYDFAQDDAKDLTKRVVQAEQRLYNGVQKYLISK